MTQCIAVYKTTNKSNEHCFINLSIEVGSVFSSKRNKKVFFFVRSIVNFRGQRAYFVDGSIIFHRNSIPVSLRRDRKSYTEELHYCNSLHSGRSISFHTKIQERLNMMIEGYIKENHQSHLAQNVTFFIYILMPRRKRELFFYQCTCQSRTLLYFNSKISFLFKRNVL